MNCVDTVVRLDDRTSVKTKGGFLRGGTNYAQTSILRGLNVEVEGRGNGQGELAAEKIRFNESDMRVARAVESLAAPLEERAENTETKLSQVEANAQRLSGQLEELAAVSNAARGGAKAAQATADAAVAGVNATNERISALDDYQPQETAAVNFRSGSAVLTTDAKVHGRGLLRSEEHTSELQSLAYLVCRLLLEKKKDTLPRLAFQTPRPLRLPSIFRRPPQPSPAHPSSPLQTCDSQHSPGSRKLLHDEPHEGSKKSGSPTCSPSRPHHPPSRQTHQHQ